MITSRIVGGLASLPWHASNVVGGAILYPFCFATQIAPTAARGRALLGASRFLMIVAMLLTMSLGVSGCATLFLVATLSPGRRVRALAVITGLVLVSVLTVKASMGDDFNLLIDIAFDLGGNSGGDISNHRFEAYQASYRYFVAHPFSPVGYGSAGSVIGDGSPGAAGTHNIWFAYLLDMGPLGVFSLALMVVVLARRALVLTRDRDPRRARLGVLSGLWLATVLAHMMVETPIYAQQVTVYFWLCSGLLIAASLPGERRASVA